MNRLPLYTGKKVGVGRGPQGDIRSRLPIYGGTKKTIKGVIFPPKFSSAMLDSRPKMQKEELLKSTDNETNAKLMETDEAAKSMSLEKSMKNGKGKSNIIVGLMSGGVLVYVIVGAALIFFLMRR